MNSKNQKKRYQEIEAYLEKKSVDQANFVRLSDSDFSDGKLSAEGYSRLKEEAKFIDKKAEMEIRIPKQYESGFKDDLEFAAARELKILRRQTDMATVQTVVLLLLGALFFVLGQIEALRQFIKEIAVIACWVFIWAAVEKMFFDPLETRANKRIICRVVSAKVTAED